MTDWLDDALNDPGDPRSLVVDGARIAYRVRGERAPGSARAGAVVLVHGGAAHAHWWDPVAPLLAADRPVFALDLSGHGDSDRRDAYAFETWAAEILAVAEATGSECVHLVGHSLGGIICSLISTWSEIPAHIAGVIAIDSPLAHGHALAAEERAVPSSRNRVYPTLDEAISRFRPVPMQESDSRIAAHIAERSLREIDGGWTWKVDRAIAGGVRSGVEADGTRVPYAFLRAEHGLMNDSIRDYITGVGGIFAELPAAGHAPMLDQPLALVAAVRTAIGGWDASRTAMPDPLNVG